MRPAEATPRGSSSPRSWNDPRRPPPSPPAPGRVASPRTDRVRPVAPEAPGTSAHDRPDPLHRRRPARRAALRRGHGRGRRPRPPATGSTASTGPLHAFLHRDPEDPCSTQARGVDAKPQGSGEPLGPLAGVPVAVEGCALHQLGEPTTCRQQDAREFPPALRRDGRRQRLRAADAVLIGKTNMDEFAMGSSTENSAYGPTKQPVGPLTRIPGRLLRRVGRRGRRRLRPAQSLGSDTGGSIRQPAALCAAWSA